MPNDALSDAHSAAARRLLFFDQSSTRQLLEVYVKRSLSLNDAAGLRAQRLKTRRKWLTPTSRGVQAKRASSDSSTHRLSIENILQTTDSEPPQSAGTPPSSCRPVDDMVRYARGSPEPSSKSFLRTFLNWFSKKGSETRTEALLSKPETHFSEPSSGESLRVVRKKHLFRTFSFKNLDRSDSQKKHALTPEDVVRLPNAVSVEPSSVYLEKVSEELERIVKEVKSPNGGSDGDLSAAAEASEHCCTADDVVERMISLLKQQGDAIDEKIKRNSSIHAFLQRLSYGSFQQLADRYLAQIPPPPDRVTTTTTAPELVQLAFTLDFTANIAQLSNQAVSRIMGFGNQYLQDRFTQICSAHTQVDGDVEGQCCSDPE